MKGALKGAALGVVLAAGAALLLAPKSGKKTRADLKKLLDTASGDLKKKVKKIQNLSQAQYEELFLHTLAHAAKKKEEVADLLGDVSNVLKRGWDDAKQELKKDSAMRKTSDMRKKRS